ncbi:hypothetical protein Moror_515 [Moniliophthora roreri MCA 2997]|uniref:Uncharacterized protein n=2 Tax=Moniliophthora roreri TaxID=221103 RepID=V2WW85_MONRO|nr:hypothetical protein Moror_515 [Moniliophthora roreri MCA 2997]KAI3607359.1 hypothetical protein WG66_004775 [Moniliophthora roreri]
MKCFTAVLSFILAATTTVAQRANIAVPTMGSNVQAGSTINVEVDRPSFASSAVEVAIVLGIRSCSTMPCHDPEEWFGPAIILYNGPYNPQYSLPPGVPHQNFTVQIPGDIAKGTAQIILAHFNLVGASLGATLQYDSVSVNII